MQSYIREYSFGNIVSETFRVYFQNFIPIFFTYLIPILPFYLLQTVEVIYEIPVELSVLNFILMILASLVAIAASTLVISDVLIGHEVSMFYAYKQAFSTVIFKLFVTILLQMLAIMVGWILLIIPGLILMVWFMLSNTVTVLEDRWGVEALKRSKNLGNTKHWRNFGVALIVMIATMAPLIFGLITSSVFLPPSIMLEMELLMGFMIAFNLIAQVVMPIPLILFVLLYYDLRVRKESYNLEALA